MKIRKIIVALAAVLVPFLVFRVGSGLTEQQNVTLRDYTVSENEKTLTLHAAVFPPIEDIRDYSISDTHLQMSSYRTAGKDGRIFRFYRPYLDLWVLRF